MGIGPYFDVTARSYPMSSNRCGLSLVAQAGLGLLYSTSKYRAKISDNTGVVTNNFEREQVKSVNTEILGRLGIGWDTRFNNHTKFGVLLGYEARHYAGALAYGEWSAPGAIAGGLGSAGFGGSSAPHAFTRQGPFLEVKFSGCHFG
jgi:hypothetical protein